MDHPKPQPRTLALKEVLEGAERAQQRVSTWPEWKRELSGSRRVRGEERVSEVPDHPDEWVPLPVPELRGIFETLEGKVRLYDVTECPAFLATDGHGVDVNPNAPGVPGKRPLRGPFRMLMIVEMRAHCTMTGLRGSRSFKVGHVEALQGPELHSWVGVALMRIMAHEVDEGLRWPEPVS